MATEVKKPISGYQRAVLQALADGYTLEVAQYGTVTEYALVKAGRPPMLLNSAGTFFALKPYLVPTLNGIGIARYAINDAGRDVLASAGS